MQLYQKYFNAQQDQLLTCPINHKFFLKQFDLYICPCEPRMALEKFCIYDLYFQRKLKYILFKMQIARQKFSIFSSKHLQKVLKFIPIVYNIFINIYYQKSLDILSEIQQQFQMIINSQNILKKIFFQSPEKETNIKIVQKKNSYRKSISIQKQKFKDSQNIKVQYADQTNLPQDCLPTKRNGCQSKQQNPELMRKIIYENKNLQQKLVKLQNEYQIQKKNCQKYKKLYEQLSKKLDYSSKIEEQKNELCFNISSIEFQSNMNDRMNITNSMVVDQKLDLNNLETILQNLDSMGIKDMKQKKDEKQKCEDVYRYIQKYELKFQRLETENKILIQRIKNQQIKQQKITRENKSLQGQNKVLKRQILQLTEIINKQKDRVSKIRLLVQNNDLMAAKNYKII